MSHEQLTIRALRSAPRHPIQKSSLAETAELSETQPKAASSKQTTRENKLDLAKER
jgi:hypothetical protein